MEKKCGNCGHGCYESTVYCQVYNEDILADNDACDEWVDPKEHHIRCDAYEQLAKVASDLYKAVAPLHKWCNEDTCCNLIDMGWPSDVCLHEIKSQLESLGVMIDD